MNLIWPNGSSKACGSATQVEFEHYGRVQLGWATAERLRLGAQRDRRQKRRRRSSN